MHTKFSILVYLFLNICCFCAAQTIITGEITNQKNQTIDGSIISILETDKDLIAFGMSDDK